jgi:hypothetical protein
MNNRTGGTAEGDGRGLGKVRFAERITQMPLLELSELSPEGVELEPQHVTVGGLTRRL